jgi:phthalate 4,5-dioxygenase
MFVPIDDENCWRFFVGPRDRGQLNPRGLGGANLFSFAPFSTPITGRRDGIVPRLYTMDNDFQLSHEARREGNFSGVSDFVSQDFMVTESMGPIYDRTQEHLGSTDKAISRMRHILLSAAKGLADGKEPPAVGGEGLDFASIRGAEKILEPGEDWRLLGTAADPVVQEALGVEP